MRLAGQPVPAVGGFGRFSGTPVIGLLGAVGLIVLGALGEETGWRGYALPRLQQRFTPLTATVILSLLWYAWHLPLFTWSPTTARAAPARTSACCPACSVARSCSPGCTTTPAASCWRPSGTASTTWPAVPRPLRGRSRPS